MEENYKSLHEMLSDGPKRFVRRFGRLIDSAVEVSTAGPEEHKLIPRAQAIVSQRDTLQGELAELEKLLNSDITRLSNELRAPYPDWRTVRDIVETLRVTWSQKEDEVVLRMARLLATMEIVLGEKLDVQRPQT